MKNNIILSLILLSFTIIVKGQEMEVEAINAMPFDLTASTNKRLDNNGKACALLKVVLPIQDVSFEGNVIGDVKYDAGEYRVYLPTGSKNLRIKHPHKRPLMVSFDDLGIRIEGGQTYQLTVKTEAGTESVTFKISPKDAILTVDQKEYPTDNGIAILSLTPDEHNYTIFAPGYQTQGNKFMVYTGQTNKIIVELDPKDANSILTTNPTFTKDLGNPTTLPEQKDNYELNAAQMNEKGEAAYNQKDYEEALKWFTKAAEQGHSGAQCNLGSMYGGGYGVSLDCSESAKWFRKAAEQGDAEGQYQLGNIYSTGLGAQKDSQEAIKWYWRAAAQGHDNALFYLEKDAEHGIENALFYLIKVAEQGFSNAQYHLGWMYKYGVGVTEDLTESRKWYKYAAEKGHSEAQYYLGKMYEEGNGVRKDITEAIKWYEKAAKQGDSAASEIASDKLKKLCVTK